MTSAVCPHPAAAFITLWNGGSPSDGREVNLLSRSVGETVLVWESVIVEVPVPRAPVQPWPDMCVTVDCCSFWPISFVRCMVLVVQRCSNGICAILFVGFFFSRALF